MKNPFDQTFFKFLFGFAFILSASFAMLFFVTQFSSTIESQEGAILSENNTE